MFQHLLPALRMTLVLTVLTGLVYPGIVTGVAQLIFPHQANGSLVSRDGRVIGSDIIGQRFNRPGYFQGRPSYAGAGYDASLSGGSNLGPTSQKLMDRVSKNVAEYRRDNSFDSDPLPADAVTASASGLDPHISPANAYLQAQRVANDRGVSMDEVRSLVAAYTETRDLGFLGEPRVNVLGLNLALDERFGVR